MTRDPVCGMYVEPHTAQARLEYGGKTWYFCSERCQAAFHKEPARYAGGKAGG
jgi:P-type Cu+ transporter